MIECKICGHKSPKMDSFSKHLNSHSDVITKEEYYLKYLDNDSRKTCKVCNKPTSFISIAQGYKTYCGIRCSNRDEDVREKIANTCLEKYGVTNASKTDEAKRKMLETQFKKYGGIGMSSPTVREKIIKTNLEKYGTENVFASDYCKEKIKEYNLKNFGVEFYSQTEEQKSKSRATCLEKYGVENAMQDPTIRKKQIHSMKTEDNKYNLEYYLEEQFLKFGIDFIPQYSSNDYPYLKERVCIQDY